MADQGRRVDRAREADHADEADNADTLDNKSSGAYVQLAGVQTITGVKTIEGAPILAGSAWPSFSAHRDGANQTGLAHTVVTKVRFKTEEFDTNDDFVIDADDSGGAAESRFTPTVAGKYLLSASVILTGNLDGAGNFSIHLYKNGAVNKSATIVEPPNGFAGIFVSAVLDANGSTDYFEIYVAQFGTGTETIDGTANATWFTGCRIG